MLCTESFAFIHVPKTGGMSVTRFLINAVDEPVSVFGREPGRQQCFDMAISPDRAEKLNYFAGNRHATPAECIAMIREEGLPVPSWGFCVIRHPVDLMIFYYKHMRKPWVWKLRGLDRDSLTGDLKNAVENNFRDFCSLSLFYGRDDHQLSEFYDPKPIGRLDIVPLNGISNYMKSSFGDSRNFFETELEHRNKSSEDWGRKDVDEETQALICSRYPSILKLYLDAVERYA